MTYPTVKPTADVEKLTMAAVRTCVEGVLRGGVVYHCTRIEGHDDVLRNGDATPHFSPAIGEFDAVSEAVSSR